MSLNFFHLVSNWLKKVGDEVKEGDIIAEIETWFDTPAFENNTPCLDTTVVNDNQSSVTFRWSLTRDTNSYRLFVTNLSTDELQQFSSENPEVTATLNHGEPYSWKVRAYGPKGTAPSESETWKFYLSGPAVDNYAPFPPELTFPISGSTVTPINNLIPLQWSCSDVDNDLSFIR